MSEENASGEGPILIYLTAEQVHQLPSGVKRAVEQLVAELRTVGSAVPATRPLSVIAKEIDQLIRSAATGDEAASSHPSADLRAALELRADELRIRDVLSGPTFPPPPPGTCGVVHDAPFAIVGSTIIILPRPRHDDPT